MKKSDILLQALSLHRSGDIKGAKIFYEKALEIDPVNPDALRLSGLASRQLGDLDEAIALLEKACFTQPRNTIFCKDYADALLEKKKYREAAIFYGKALSIEPADPETWFRTASAHYGSGNIESALEDLNRAIELKPDYFEALCNCAEILRTQGNYEQALSSLDRAIALNPGLPHLHNSAGQICEKIGETRRAIHHYRIALQLDDTFAEAHNNLGNVLAIERNFDEAVLSYKKALKLRPGFFEAYYNLGNCLRETNNFDEAITCFRAALRIQPSSVQALTNYGEALQTTGRINEAQQCYRTINAEADKPCPKAFGNLLLCTNYDVAYSPGQLFEEHSLFGKTFGLSADSISQNVFNDTFRKLRIGYVSPDFCDHPVAKFIEPVLMNHNRETFDIYCYADCQRQDIVGRRIRAMSLCWRDINNMTDQQVSHIIRDDKIDILIDLAGHTSGNRLMVFARKPAPVQMSYCGYPNTTGLPAIDYYITDNILDPDGADSFYVERLLHIPGCFCCFKPPANAPDVNKLPALKNGYVTFGSFHPLMRINECVIDLWCSVLRAIPDSRLRIVRNTLAGSVRKRIENDFAKHGMAMHRIELTNEIPAQGYLHLYDNIDISLDTLPWSGHTLACESLWMGVPVITLYGNRHAGRMATSILRNAGLPEWVALTKDQYCGIAVAASSSFDKLSDLRGGLRSVLADSIICNGGDFTRKLEDAYRSVWISRCAG